jgi:hypothetical protein
MDLCATTAPGACCDPAGACAETTPDGCPGTFVGPGTACDPSPCATPDAGPPDGGVLDATTPADEGAEPDVRAPADASAPPSAPADAAMPPSEAPDAAR